jgi:cyanophycinase-like exopeptidase
LRLVPGLVVLPHFDRWVGRMGPATLKALAATLPETVTLIGVDEDTALVNLDGHATSDGPSRWHVLGRQTVSVIDAEHGRVQHSAGSTLELRAAF